MKQEVREMAYQITSDCIGCTLCTRQCPTGAISGMPKEVQTIDAERCIDCGLCGRVCPKSAIKDMNGLTAEKIAKKDWKKPSIDRETCVGCSLCVENCPADCLEIESAKFHGDIDTIAVLAEEGSCIDCRICEAVCPIGAIRFETVAEEAAGDSGIKTDDGITIPTKDDVYRAFCRTYQGVFKIGMYAIPWGMPETVEGPGAVRKLPPGSGKRGTTMCWW